MTLSGEGVLGPQTGRVHAVQLSQGFPSTPASKTKINDLKPCTSRRSSLNNLRSFSMAACAGLVILTLLSIASHANASAYTCMRIISQRHVWGVRTSGRWARLRASPEMSVPGDM